MTGIAYLKTVVFIPGRSRPYEAVCQGFLRREIRSTARGDDQQTHYIDVEGLGGMD